MRSAALEAAMSSAADNTLAALAEMRFKTPGELEGHLLQMAEIVTRAEQLQAEKAPEAEKAFTRKQINKELKWFKTKFGSMEMRAMCGNIFGHETVRQIEDQYKTQSIHIKIHDSIKRNANQYTSS